jgi:hypothetical protein
MKKLNVRRRVTKIPNAFRGKLKREQENAISKIQVKE